MAEIIGLSPTHVSVIERKVKAPKLETFIGIVNTLDVTSDSLLLDVLDNSLQITATELSERIKNLPPNYQRRFLNAVRVLAEDDVYF
ncbi:helix-turn-helix transcriptional regulator [Lachnospiraceae bacterium 45-W7]